MHCSLYHRWTYRTLASAISTSNPSAQMEQDKGLSKGTQCSLCKTSSALGLCCRDDLALTPAPMLQPILPPWNRCPAQFPSSCPPTQPPTPYPHPTCAQFCPSSTKTPDHSVCLHLFLHFFTLKDFQHHPIISDLRENQG